MQRRAPVTLHRDRVVARLEAVEDHVARATRRDVDGAAAGRVDRDLCGPALEVSDTSTARNAATVTVAGVMPVRPTTNAAGVRIGSSSPAPAGAGSPVVAVGGVLGVVAVAVGGAAVAVGVVVVGTASVAVDTGGAEEGCCDTLEDWSFVSPHPSAPPLYYEHSNVTARMPTTLGDKEVLR